MGNSIAVEPHMFLHHASELNDELVFRLMKEASPHVHTNGATVTPMDYDRWLKLVREDRYWRNIPSFNYKVPVKGAAATDVRLLVCLVHGQVELSSGNFFRPEQVFSEPRTWAKVAMGTLGVLDWNRVESARWLIERTTPIIKILQPDYGFMDHLRSVARRSRNEPRSVAWPWMLFGPELVATHGREHVLKTPAWKVEELPYGAIVVQAAENPFTATRAEVRQVAEHLGLENPR